MRRQRVRWAGIVATFAACTTLSAQEQPLSVNGTFFSGYYNTWTRGEANQQISFVPLGAKFDINGYALVPDLLTFTVQPELNLGPEAGEAGFEGGNGISLRVTALRKRAPLTLRYSNVRVQDVYFGSLSQISAYQLATRMRDLGLTWDFKPANLPALTVDWGTGGVDSKSGTPGIPDYNSNVQHVNVDSRYERWGWDLENSDHFEWQQSTLFAPFAGINTSALTQDVQQVSGSARRTFLADSELYLDAGSQSTSSLLFTTPIDLRTRYASVNLRLFQKRRWKASIRAGYSSNVTSLLLANLVNSLAGSGPGAVAPDASQLLPFEHTIGNLNIDATTSYTLGHGFGLYGRADRGEALASAQDGAVASSYFDTSAGVTYSGTFHWGSLGAQYGRDIGVGSITGQSGTISGNNYLVSAQHHTSGGFEFDGSVHGSDQSIHNAQPASNSSFSVEGSIAHKVVGLMALRVGGGWDNGAFQSGPNTFQTRGYTARVGIEHPRLQLNASLNESLGNSLPVSAQVYGDLALGSTLLSTMPVIPSNLHALAFTIHSNPLRKVEFSAVWTRSLQHLNGIIDNDFQILDIRASYHFRMIKMDFGYTRSSQLLTTFTAYPETFRGRLYIRISRSAHIL